MTDAITRLAPLLVTLLAGCVSVSESTDAARDRAAQAGLAWQQVRAGRFELAVAGRGLDGADTLVVYVEGDGRAWRSRERLARDPTPRHAVGLALAARDRSAAVLYVARPCQFVGAGPAEGCEPRFWSTHRYGEAVVDAVSLAIDAAAARGAAPRIVLVGYSGGGTVAALVAARRRDVACLVTVAANLDHAAWTAFHGVTPLDGSLNPAAEAARLRGLRQVHFAGALDEVVPVSVLDSYLAALGAGATATRRVVPGFGHECCWADAWPGLVGPAPAPCGAPAGAAS